MKPGLTVAILLALSLLGTGCGGFDAYPGPLSQSQWRVGDTNHVFYYTFAKRQAAGDQLVLEFHHDKNVEYPNAIATIENISTLDEDDDPNAAVHFEAAEGVTYETDDEAKITFSLTMLDFSKGYLGANISGELRHVEAPDDPLLHVNGWCMYLPIVQ